MFCEDVRARLKAISQSAKKKKRPSGGGRVVEQAVLRIIPATTFFRGSFSRWEDASFTDLREGDWIIACFGGPLTESYPVQVMVRQVVILDVSRFSGL